MTATPPALLTSTLRLSPHVELLLRTLKARLREESVLLSRHDYQELLASVSEYCSEELRRLLDEYLERGRPCVS